MPATSRRVRARAGMRQRSRGRCDGRALRQSVVAHGRNPGRRASRGADLRIQGRRSPARGRRIPSCSSTCGIRRTTCRIRPFSRASCCTSTKRPIGSGFRPSTSFTYGRGATIRSAPSWTGIRRSRVRGADPGRDQESAGGSCVIQQGSASLTGSSGDQGGRPWQIQKSPPDFLFCGIRR